MRKYCKYFLKMDRAAESDRAMLLNFRDRQAVSELTEEVSKVSVQEEVKKKKRKLECRSAVLHFDIELGDDTD